MHQNDRPVMGAAEIDAFRAPGQRYAGPDTAEGRRAPLATPLRRQGRMTPGQTAGRFYPVACVALEVTQRCNLDCTLCYLSAAAEAAHDVPMAVLFARLRAIRDHFGPGTAVQISGGDPTLRRVEDLEALCHEIRRLELWPCLMTNGIRATRAMLTRLAEAGLGDVAFHVDTTQERPGGDTEAALDAVRRDYLARARGLGLRVFFNTTVHAGNMAELPALARFFRAHAHEITMASFQLQADTGRGVMGGRKAVVTQAGVEAALAEGFDTALDFGLAGVGHEACNRYASVLVAGDRATAALGDRALFHRIVAAFEAADRGERATAAFAPLLRRAALAAPLTALRAALHVAGRVLRLGPGLVASRGRVARLSLFVHNFMDAAALERERCEACVFRVATEDGPLSMCVHNARRDRHLFQPARIETAAGQRWWSAATGRLTRDPEAASPGVVPPKRRKGRDAVARRPRGSERA